MMVNAVRHNALQRQKQTKTTDDDCSVGIEKNELGGNLWVSKQLSHALLKMFNQKQNPAHITLTHPSNSQAESNSLSQPYSVQHKAQFQCFDQSRNFKMTLNTIPHPPTAEPHFLLCFQNQKDLQNAFLLAFIVQYQF